jgi:hypothetical protein
MTYGTDPDAAPPDGDFQLRLREPVDVLGAIPYLIGYHPDESLVVVGMHDRELIVTLRAELPEHEEAARTCAEGLQTVLRDTPVDGAILVAYGPDERVRPMVSWLSAGLGQLGVTLVEALRADGRRYWSYVCDDPLCCPLEGTPYDVRGSRVAAEATLAGLSVLPDRAAYEDQVNPVSGQARVAMAEATERSHARLHELIADARGEEDLRTRMVRAAQTALAAGLRAQRFDRRLDDDEAAWLSVLACWSEVTDVALARLGETRAAVAFHRGLWLDVLRRCVPDLVPAPGTLFAVAAWQRGELALARLALDRVFEADPHYALGHVVENLMEQGLPASLVRHVPERNGPSTMDSRSPRRLKRVPGRRPRRRSSSRRAGSPPG